jgi:TonB family protein
MEMKKRLLMGALALCLLTLVCSVPGTRAQEGERKVVKQVQPEYPEILRKMEIGGTVRLRVVVKPDGSVKETSVLGGDATLAIAAQRAVSQWKFTQASSSSTIEVKVIFDPHRQ